MKPPILKQNNLATLLLITFSVIFANCQTVNRCSEENLFQFIESNKFDKLEECIGNGIDPDFKNEEGLSLLYSAVNNDKPDIVKMLISKNADPFSYTPEGVPILRYAQQSDLFAIATVLQEFQITGWDNSDVKDTLLFFQLAIEHNNKILAEALISAGADPNMKLPNALLPVAWAAFSGSPEVLQKLLTNGGSPDAEFDTRAALIIGAMNGNLKVVQILVSAGADINNYEGTGMTALMFATEYNYPDIAQYLLQRGADKTMTNKSGETALDLAIKKGNTDIIELLSRPDEEEGNQAKVSPTGK